MCGRFTLRVPLGVLVDQFAAIDTASSVGDLKRITEAAIAVAENENDADAVAQIRKRAETKAAKAKPAVKKPVAETVDGDVPF